MAPFSNTFDDIDCTAVDCATGALGAIEELDPSCPLKADKSEINYIILSHPTKGVGPTGWDTATALDWNTVIDNTDATDVNLKRIPVRGSKPNEERPDIPSTNGVVIKGEGLYTISLAVLDLPDGLYNYLRKIQCGKVIPKFWYEDRGGNMYGKEDGIVANSINVSFPKDEGDDAYNRAEITITFYAQVDPQRITSVLQ